MYILTEEEYDEMNLAIINAAKESEKILQDLCTRVANSEPVKEGWYGGKVWGCILTKTNAFGYCDYCPVRDVCPYPYKSWSK
jgi:hypothetical protein